MPSYRKLNREWLGSIMSAKHGALISQEHMMWLMLYSSEHRYVLHNDRYICQIVGCTRRASKFLMLGYPTRDVVVDGRWMKAKMGCHSFNVCLRCSCDIEYCTWSVNSIKRSGPQILSGLVTEGFVVISQPPITVQQVKMEVD